MLAQFYAPIVGGEEQLVRTLSTELAERGHEVAVATQWHVGLPQFELDRGVRVYRIRGTLERVPGLFSETGRRHAPPFPDPGLTRELARIVARERPQIVHGHNWLVRSYLPLKRPHGPRLVVSLHDYSLACARKNLQYFGAAPCEGPGLTRCPGCAVDNFGLAKGSVTVVSNWAAGEWQRRTVDMYLPVSRAVATGNGLADSGAPFQVLPNFLPDRDTPVDPDSEDLEPYVARLPPPGFLMYAGDLSRVKGINVLLRAYADLSGPSVPPLVLIGRILPETPRQLPPNVLMFDAWPHVAVMEAWRRSMLGFLPSIWEEPFGIVLLEAMKFGRPVIASRVGGITDIVLDGVTGLLVPPGDADALRGAIQRLLDEPDLRQQMGGAAEQRLVEFQARTVVPRFEQVYAALAR
jgi:glycosyltransferase involved in cell wall biosynthesis